jgi:hypothetical protein
MISDFRKTRIFLRGGLDRPNQLEPAHENRFLARRDLALESWNSLGRLPLGIQPDLIDSIVPGCPIIAERH